MNRRIVHVLIVAAALGALLVRTAARMDHADRDFSRPSAAAPPSPRDQAAHPSPAMVPGINPPFPQAYAILLTRNIFSSPHKRGSDLVHGPEASFVFKGTIRAGATFTAFIEDLSAPKIIQAIVGDSVARGRIQFIDLDSIGYETGGTVRRIEVGQNFDGQAAPSMPASRPAIPQTNPAQTPVKDG